MYLIWMVYSHLFVVGRLLAIPGANWPGAAGAGDQRIFSLKKAEPIGGHHHLKNTNISFIHEIRDLLEC
jgi:hypothetical protein